MEYTNANKLSAVLAKWARPAVSKIASDKLTSMSWIKSIQQGIVSLGIVRSNYDISYDIEPLLQPAVDALVEPMLNRYLSKLPDESIPIVARNIVSQMKSSGCVSLLDGLVVLEKTDINELERLIELNLPMSEVQHYNVITNDE